MDDERCADSSPKSKGLLGRDDPSPVFVVNRGGSSPFLLLGDHAGRAIPQKLNGLGLPPEALDQHIAWDIGIHGLGERLSALLDATFIRQSYSRLVVDCNRKHTAADFVAAVSDGQAIPGNADLKTSDRSARRREVHMPYHHRITGALEARDQQALDTILVALHSFTPSMNGIDRPWHYGVLHRDDSKASAKLLAALRAELGDKLVGDNQPYAMDGVDYTIPFHADPRGLDYLEIEIRQDLLADAPGQDAVAALLAKVLAKVA
ncbi:MAG: N-formylglutamate amidohydrolase [Caulobacter sp.]|nr:N-formylglutamate amidohydrolase [Caulobacter sp.]